jgi:2-keto-4-pentenoate hydratase/2-oxohepta-3-ene-1,7-dioic acid hydratase in catechol pathway
MRLITFHTGRPEASRLGVLMDDGSAVDLTASGEPVLADMLSLIEAGEAGLAAADRARAKGANRLRVDELKLRAPLPLPPQIRDAMCFHKHIRQSQTAQVRRRARESGDPARLAEAERFAETYQLPEVYSRQPTYYKSNRFAVGDPESEVVWPAYSQVMDFELELACVIGRRGKDIAKAGALAHVFGFTIFNDFSARDAQYAEMEGRLGPAKGKDFDNANVFGPCLVTLDEIGDPQALRMTARVNGETVCEGSSADMYWRFDEVIAHISAGETLHPGEIICSGTVGDGCGLEHLRFLEHGDVVELEIEKIGVLRNRVVRPGGESQ